MKKSAFVLPVVALLAGILVGGVAYRMYVYSTGIMSLRPLMLTQPFITGDEANRLFTLYYNDAAPMTEKFKAMTIDKQQMTAMVQLATKDTTIKAFRVYPGRDVNQRSYGLVVGVDSRGLDMTTNQIIKTDKVRLDPCPPICDVSSPILRNIP